MARVLDPLGKSKRHPLLPRSHSRNDGLNLIEMELGAAKEILAEVFGITVQEVEEMIRQRSEERMLWPERFWLVD
ncbi:Uncharacterised protein [uncultured archaeon]|nr:Uncharacterised protein [uncultured archaeon]